jgi:Flp pilus assembly protein TadD
MDSIPPPDYHYLEAALGWLMLGNPPEARAEFEQVAAAYRQHPQTLQVEWRLLADEKRWREALAPAEAHIAVAPADPAGYIHRSYALHELKQTEEALQKLLPAAALFPTESTIPYNLACYSCQLGDLDAARHWLRHAFAIETSDRQRQLRREMALQDVDLQPLWPELRQGKE